MIINARCDNGYGFPVPLFDLGILISGVPQQCYVWDSPEPALWEPWDQDGEWLLIPSCLGFIPKVMLDQESRLRICQQIYLYTGFYDKKVFEWSWVYRHHNWNLTKPKSSRDWHWQLEMEGYFYLICLVLSSKSEFAILFVKNQLVINFLSLIANRWSTYWKT